MELEEATFSGPVVLKHKAEQPKSKKRASTISSKDEQVFAGPKEDIKQTVFGSDDNKNFRSTSPPFRESEIQAFTDMKIKKDIGDKSGFQSVISSDQILQKKLFNLKRTSLSPPSNLFFSVPKEQLTPNEIQKVIKMFPRQSPKVSPDPKA